jgi:hypothetical protein
MVIIWVIYVMVSVGVAVGYYQLVEPAPRDRVYIAGVSVLFGLAWPAVVAYVWVRRD